MSASNFTSLARLTSQCRDLLQALHLEIRSDVEDDQNATAVYNALGRFNVWDINLGVFRRTDSKLSIDWRLRKAERMKGRVQEVLEELAQNAARAQEIVEGAVANRNTSDLQHLLDSPDITDDEKRDLKEMLSPTSTELDELIKSFQLLVNRLFRLAILIKRDAITRELDRRVLHIQPEGQDTPAQIGFSGRLQDRFSSLQMRRPQLFSRLVAGFIQRRNWIVERHRWAIGDPENKPPQNDLGVAGGLSNEHSSTRAAHLFEEALDTEAPREETDTSSIFSEATSFASACGDGDDDEITFPDLTKLEFNGKRLEYGCVFQCPFCHDLEMVQSEKDWRAHLMMDLMPYMCTFEGCSSGLFQFRHEWFSHELEAHRSTWHCAICPMATFSNRDQLSLHYQSTHSPEVTEDEARCMTDRSARPVENYMAESCPFCDAWAAPDQDQAMNFCRHVGRHQQQLALEAIPADIEGLLIVEDDLPKVGNRTDANARTEPAGEPRNEKITEEEAEKRTARSQPSTLEQPKVDEATQQRETSRQRQDFHAHETPMEPQTLLGATFGLWNVFPAAEEREPARERENLANTGQLWRETPRWSGYGGSTRDTG